MGATHGTHALVSFFDRPGYFSLTRPDRHLRRGGPQFVVVDYLGEHDAVEALGLVRRRLLGQLLAQQAHQAGVAALGDREVGREAAAAQPVRDLPRPVGAAEPAPDARMVR